jgi:hypothetical protein
MNHRPPDPPTSTSVPVGGEGTAEIGQGTVASHLQDQVITPARAGEVLLGVVDHLVGPDRSDQLRTVGAAHPGHLGAERLGQLDREAAHPTRGPDDHDPLAWLDLPGVAERLEGREPGDGHGRGLLKGEVGRLQDELALGDRGVLGKGAVAPAEDRITWLQLGHPGADRLDAAGHVEAWNIVLWVGEPVAQAGDIGQALDRQPVTFPDGRRAYLDQHGIVGDHRLVDVLELQGIGWAVPGMDDRLHRLLLRRRGVGGEDLSGRHGPAAGRCSYTILSKAPAH